MRAEFCAALNYFHCTDRKFNSDCSGTVSSGHSFCVHLLALTYSVFVHSVRFFQYGSFDSYRFIAYHLGKSSREKENFCVQQFQQVLELSHWVMTLVMTSSSDPSLCPRG